jgi:importin subunit beta-1
MAGATCLTLIANCVRNEIVEPVIEFVSKYINSSEWRMREAASMAFGSILEGVYDMQPTIVQVPLPSYCSLSSCQYKGN